MKKRNLGTVIIILMVILAVVCVVVISVGTKRTYEDKPLVQKDENIVENIESEKKYKVSTYITQDMKEKAKLSTPIICWKYSFSPEYLYNECDNIAIIRVISVDKASSESIAYGMTFGKALVNNIIHGSLKEEDTIEFSKFGGLLEKGEYSYTNLILENDYSIEEGKTYLVYLKYIEEYGSYHIIGIGYGLRELNIPKEDKHIGKIDIDFNNTKIVKNQNVHELSDISFESLQEYIDKYINVYK